MKEVFEVFVRLDVLIRNRLNLIILIRHKRLVVFRYRSAPVPGRVSRYKIKSHIQDMKNICIRIKNSMEYYITIRLVLYMLLPASSLSFHFGLFIQLTL